MSETFSTFLASELHTSKNHSQERILGLRYDAEDRLRQFNNRPSDSPLDPVYELAVIVSLLIKIGVHQDAVMYSGQQLAMLDRSKPPD